MLGLAAMLAVSGSPAMAQPALDVPAPPTERTWYTPVVPGRLLDTRPGGETIDGLGRPATPLRADSTLTVPVLGRAGVPTGGVAAVVLNVTVTNPTAASFLTVWPNGSSRPTASNLNFTAGQTVPNLVIAKVGVAGSVAIYNLAGNVDVVVDVAGYMPISDGYEPLVPARLLETRPGLPTVDGRGRPHAPLGPQQTMDLDVLGRGGVPFSDVDSVALNVTVTNPTAGSFLTVWPSGTERPVASNLNMVPGQTVPNFVVAKVGAGGRVSFYNHSGSTDVVADVAGYFRSDGTFTALRPSRIFETRSGEFVPPGAVNRGLPIGAGDSIDVQVAGRLGVPIAGVSAVVLNVTAIRPAGPSFLTVFPTGTLRPNASNLNLTGAGQVVPNLVVAKVGAGGKVSIYNHSGYTDVAIDVAGYFVAETGYVRDLDLSGESTCVLFEVGTVDCWGTLPQDPAYVYGGEVFGGRPTPYEVNTVDDAVDIALGTHHTCVLRAAGDVECWASPTVFGLAGVDAFRQVWPAVRIALPLRAVEIEATYTHTCALLANGTVWCWGRDYAGVTRSAPFAVGNLDQVETLSMGMTHACAVRSNGGVRCWGNLNDGSTGALGDGTGIDSPTSAVDVAGLTDAESVSVGGIRACAVRTGGGVRCWGSGHGVVPVDLMGADSQSVSDVVQVVTGEAFACVLRGDATVACSQTRGGPIPTTVMPGLPPVASLASGRWHACAVGFDSALFCWGLNQYGQIGDGTFVDRPAPRLILEFV